MASKNHILLPQNGIAFKEHALQNSLVVKKVFQYLETSADFNTLKNIRQICILWRNESLSWWRKTAKLCLIPNGKSKACLSNQGTFSILLSQMHHDIGNVYQLEEKPLHKFKLQNVKLNVSYNLEYGIGGNTLWNILGTQIKQLTLFQMELFNELSSQMDNVNAFVQFLVHHVPTLETLEMENITFSRSNSIVPKSSSAERFQHSRIKVLKMKSSISTLCLYPFPFPNLEHFYMKKCGLNDAFSLVASQLKNVQLKRLEIHFPVMYNISRFVRLIRIHKFSELSHFSAALTKHSSNSLIDYLPDLLVKHCESLKSLELFTFPLASPYQNFLFNRQWGKLVKMRLWGNVASDLKFLRCCPNLKVLHMDMLGIEKREALRENVEVWNQHEALRYISGDALTEGNMNGVCLAKLEYLQMYCRLSVSSLEKLSAWIPNLKTLKTVLKCYSIQAISEQWPLLEHLVGLPGSKLEDKDVFKTDAKSLLDLKALKSFQLNTYCNGGLLTDRSVDSGFLKMHKLEDLQLCVSSQFSDEAEKRLKDYIPGAKVIRNNNENQEHVNWECCGAVDFIHFYRENFPAVLIE